MDVQICLTAMRSMGVPASSVSWTVMAIGSVQVFWSVAQPWIMTITGLPGWPTFTLTWIFSSVRAFPYASNWSAGAETEGFPSRTRKTTTRVAKERNTPKNLIMPPRFEG